MVNRVFCNNNSDDSTLQQLTSDATIEVAIDIPFPFQALPVEAIESSGRQVLEQLLRVMLPRFLKQVSNIVLCLFPMAAFFLVHFLSLQPAFLISSMHCV